MGEVYLNKKPVVEEYEYAYVETSDGAITKVPRNKIYPYVPASEKDVEALSDKLDKEVNQLSHENVDLKSDLNDISFKGNYIDYSTKVENKFWSATGTLSDGSGSTFAYSEKIELKPNKPYYLYCKDASKTVWLFNYVTFKSNGQFSRQVVRTSIPFNSDNSATITLNSDEKYIGITCYNPANGLVVLSEKLRFPFTDKKQYLDIPDEFISGNMLSKDANGLNIVTVGTGKMYEDIQSAIDNCNDSETNPVIILVYPGEYERFSMIDNDRRLHYISIIGIDRERTIIKSNTGNYNTPPAEIWTNGIIKNLSFIMKTTDETYSPDTSFNYSYAMHSDFGSCNTLFENCYFESNSGPAVGLGLFSNERLIFRNCDFLCDRPSKYGSDYGAVFCHTNTTPNTVNQFVEFTNCDAIDEGAGDTFGFYLRVMPSGESGSTYSCLLRNCYSMGKESGVMKPRASIGDGFLHQYSHGNNLDKLNA